MGVIRNPAPVNVLPWNDSRQLIRGIALVVAFVTIGYVSRWEPSPSAPARVGSSFFDANVVRASEPVSEEEEDDGSDDAAEGVPRTVESLQKELQRVKEELNTYKSQPNKKQERRQRSSVSMNCPPPQLCDCSNAVAAARAEAAAAEAKSLLASERARTPDTTPPLIQLDENMCARGHVMIVQSDTRVPPLEEMPEVIASDHDWEMADKSRFWNVSWTTFAPVGISLWAAEHGYQYRWVPAKEMQELHTRHPSWSKLLVVRQLMDAHPEVEWFWWVDTDINVRHIEFNLERAAARINASVVEDMCTAIPPSDKPYSPDPESDQRIHMFWSMNDWDDLIKMAKGELDYQTHNCGIWVIRNTRRSRQILHEWWNTCPSPEEACWMKHPWEQPLWTTRIKPKYLHNTALLQESVFSNINSMHLQHWWGGSAQRATEFRVSASYFAVRRGLRALHQFHMNEELGIFDMPSDEAKVLLKGTGA